MTSFWMTLDKEFQVLQVGFDGRDDYRDDPDGAFFVRATGRAYPPTNYDYPAPLAWEAFDGPYIFYANAIDELAFFSKWMDFREKYRSIIPVNGL